ncbi:hypothetical protein PoB_000599100 [Plakobranchus ocellatus]|uniref:Uncharacterized protein n=1 Tax=Plakobranchus ocellatus TaxID=259542 RepID=A0AAV3Y8E1_9GAST|nr:hypothetical protein PoB_000599100 [Plakobranchus ocellatus]
MPFILQNIVCRFECYKNSRFHLILSDPEEQVKMAAVAVSYGDFCELRSFMHPPQAVRELFLAVLLLLGEPVHKASQVLECNVRHIDLGTALKAKDALKPFTVEIMRNVSAAAEALFLSINNFRPVLWLGSGASGSRWEVTS